VRALALGLALAASAASAEAPRVNYMLQCQGCHGPDGRGAPGTVPTLEGVGRFLAVPGGREYLVRVPGSSQSALDDAGLAEVLNWMIREFDPRDFAPYTAEEVSRVRRPPLDDVDAVRRGLLRELEAPSPPR
jgi:mono/diheme cytochrome c family protein